MAISFKIHGFLYVAFVAAAIVESVSSLPKFIGPCVIDIGDATFLIGIMLCHI